MIGSILGIVAGLVLFFFVAQRLIHRGAMQALRRQQEKLRTASIVELVAEARRCLMLDASLDAFAPAQRILHEEAWSEATLLAALDDLLGKVRDDDRVQGRRPGPGSLSFGFYDCGLRTVQEALQHRARAGTP